MDDIQKNKFECKGEAHESWGATFRKRVHFLTLINLEDFMKNLNKTQMIRHRILRDLLGAGLVLDLMPMTFDISSQGPCQ